MTRESLIEFVRERSIELIDELSVKEHLYGVKLVYGAGAPGVRGRCVYNSWERTERLELIEICAFGEESPIQLVGTTVHEFAHCLAGAKSGHGRRWKAIAHRLGLLRPRAAGQQYTSGDFDRTIWPDIEALPEFTDGRPRLDRTSVRPCLIGVGTRGGKSRGPGSGSRLRLFVCKCEPAIRVRVARNEFFAVCLKCKRAFESAH